MKIKKRRSKTVADFFGLTEEIGEELVEEVIKNDKLVEGAGLKSGDDAFDKLVNTEH